MAEEAQTTCEGGGEEGAKGGSETSTLLCLIHPFFPSSHSVPSAESSTAPPLSPSLPPSMLIPLSSALEGSSLFFPRANAAFQMPCCSPERFTFGLNGGEVLTVDDNPGCIQGHRAGKNSKILTVNHVSLSPPS